MNDMNRDDGVTGALRRLKEDDRELGASAAVETRLRDEVRAIARRRQRHFKILWLEFAAAVVVLGAVSFWWLRGDRHALPGDTPVQVAAQATTEFFPLFYGSVPSAHTHLVRMEVPRTALVRFGLASGDAINRTAGTVLADVIVGDDGLARAVRFIQVFQEQKQ